MKKFLTLIALILMFSIGCEKETKLSEFVIGTWKSQEVVLGTNPVEFTVNIKSEGRTWDGCFYYLTLVSGENIILLPKAHWKVDNDLNQIIIDEPDFNPNDNTVPDGTVTFSVDWEKDGNTMTWTPVETGTEQPTLEWTKI